MDSEKHRVIKKGNDSPLLWVCVILILNAIVTFGYVASTSTTKVTPWALLSVNFVFFLGLTQAGIVFAAIMRIAQSEWARYFNRLGEILTLAYFPFAFIVFIVIYIGGTEHLFYWARPAVEGAHGGGHALSPWLGTGLFFWRNIILMALFYIMSYVYFVTARKEEQYEWLQAPSGLHGTLNVMAGLVIFFYVILNTNIAWDFGMMIIQHWESTIFPAYWWCGNLFAGFAFLYIISVYFIKNRTGKPLFKSHLNSYGVLLMGFTLLWVYMYWSQHIVIWYGDIPPLTGPVLKQTTGAYFPLFILMVALLFIIPFIALTIMKVKSCMKAMIAVSVLICVGLWVSRYLMILPIFEDATICSWATWTNLSLILGGLASTILPVMIFTRLFPNVPISTEPEIKDHSGH